MALIQYTIGKDDNGKAVVTYSVQSIGPGDQIAFVSDWGDAATAVSCEGDSPFQDPPAGTVYNVAAAGAPLLVVKTVLASAPIQWSCGEANGDGFTAWPGTGPIFPPIGPGK
jgi:hypothetical protein